MCCTWALNPVHAKMKSPIFYSEIAAESVRFYYWMMNVHIPHRRHHCYHDDGSKLCYWNWNQWRFKEKWREKKNNFSRKKVIRGIWHYLSHYYIFTWSCRWWQQKTRKIYCNSYSFIHDSLELSNWHTIKLNGHFFISLFHDFHVFFHWSLHEILSDELSGAISIKFSLNKWK